MKSKKKWIILFLFVAFFSTTVSSQLQAQSDIKLSCHDFLKKAVENDPQFKSILHTYLKTKYAKVSVRSINAWTLSSSVGLIHTETAIGSQLLASVQPLTDTDTLNYTVGIEKLFFNTGTRIGVEHSNSLIDLDYTYGAINQELKESEPKFTLSIMQPLLKNAFGLAERFPLIQAKLQQEAARLDAEEAWEIRLVDLYDAYLSWVAAYESVKAFNDILQDLKKLETQVAKKVRAGVAERSDLLRTKHNVLSIETQLEQAQGTYHNESINVLFLKAGKVISSELKHCDPAETSIMPQSMPQIEKTLQLSVTELRIIRKLELLKKQLQETETVANNDALPSLDLIGEITLKGKSDDTNGGYEAISDKKDYTVMLQASYPLGNPKAKGDSGKAKAGIEELNQSIASMEQSLTLNKLQLMETIKRTATIVDLQRKQLANAEEKLKLDTKSYQIGRLDTFYLIDAQNVLTNARLQLVNTEIQLKRLKIQFLALNDQLLPLFSEFEKKTE